MFSGSPSQTSAQIIAFPLIGVCAIALAARGERLGLATLLVGIPILSNLLNEHGVR